MNAQELLQEISDYCRQSGLAESTFGRRAVNDGKLTSRLRNGGRITTETLDRIRTFMSANAGMQGERPMVIQRMRPPAPSAAASMPAPRPAMSAQSGTDPAGNFRFFDNRQKYLLFVNTCSEKWVVANRVALELANIHPRPPAVRVFDAGMGDGTVLTRVMRAMHHKYPNMPFYISGKEISLEDIRLTLEKMPDRFFEHPSTVLVLTNMYYSEAPWLTVKSAAAAGSLVWNEVALTGNTSHDFEEQITGLAGFSGRELEGRRQRQKRQSGLREAGRAGAVPAGSQIPAGSDHPASRPGAMRISIWSSPRSPIAPAPRRNSRRAK